MHGEHRLSPIYTKAFETFLAHTNEKKVLLQEIIRRVKDSGAHSMLDIGAGNGNLAIPLSKVVQDYTALEQKRDFIEKLKLNSINTIEGIFPVPISRKFDFILFCHSLPYKPERFTAFIQASVKLLNSGGRLLVVIFDDEGSEWHKLLSQVALDTKPAVRLQIIAKLLGSLGEVSKNEVITRVVTNSKDELISALAFVYSDGKPEKAEQFLNNKQLKTQLETYHTNAGYEFPFRHIFFEFGVHFC